MGEIQFNGASQNAHVLLSSGLKNHTEKTYKLSLYNLKKDKPQLSSTFKDNFRHNRHLFSITSNRARALALKLISISWRIYLDKDGWAPAAELLIQ